MLDYFKPFKGTIEDFKRFKSRLNWFQFPCEPRYLQPQSDVFRTIYGRFDAIGVINTLRKELMTKNHIGELSINGDKFGLGFMVTTPEGYQAKLGLSPDSYTWAGFFGTNSWVDPQKKLICILFVQQVPVYILRSMIILKDWFMMRYKTNNMIILTTCREYPGPDILHFVQHIKKVSKLKSYQQTRRRVHHLI